MTQQKTQRLETLQAPVVERKKQGILSRISLPAALAAALTAVTSFLFSARLGLTGSLIGAGIGAVVSTIASQVYNAMISDSIEKVHDLTVQMHALAEEHQATHEMPAIDKTQIRPLPPELADEAQKTSPITGTPIAPDALREEAARRHARSLAHRTFAVAAITALLVLAGYAAIVNVATKGQGIGPTSLEQATSPTSSADEARQDKASAQETPDDTQEQQSSPADEPQKEDQADPSEEQPTPAEDQDVSTEEQTTPAEETTTPTPADEPQGNDQPTTDGSQTQAAPTIDEATQQGSTESETPTVEEEPAS